MAPDIDVVCFHFGISYADLAGHRGVSHSLAAAFISGGLGALTAPFLRCGRLTAFSVIFLAIASHIALDAATTGGLGVAAFWPLSEERYFLPWRPIRVSPFDPRAFLGSRGLEVIKSELLWVWLPVFSGAFFLRLVASTPPPSTEKTRLKQKHTKF